MPQSMQQKRKSSLERLKQSIKLHERPVRLNGIQIEHTANKIANLTRMVLDTECAIHHNR